MTFHVFPNHSDFFPMLYSEIHCKRAFRTRKIFPAESLFSNEVKSTTFKEILVYPEFNMLKHTKMCVFVCVCVKNQGVQL